MCLILLLIYVSGCNANCIRGFLSEECTCVCDDGWMGTQCDGKYENMLHNTSH